MAEPADKWASRCNTIRPDESQLLKNQQVLLSAKTISMTRDPISAKEHQSGYYMHAKGTGRGTYTKVHLDDGFAVPFLKEKLYWSLDDVL